MSDDARTHAHHMLRATAIHNGTKAKLEAARAGLESILRELTEPIGPGDNVASRAKRVVRMARISLDSSTP